MSDRSRLARSVIRSQLDSRLSRLGAAVLLVAAACTPTSSAPPSTGAVATPAPGTASPSDAAERIRLVVDTDMAPDDVVAIASLVRDPRVELLAITVVGTGEAHCPGGMYVARSVLTMLEAEPIPVACGRETPIGDAEPFPDAWRDGADVANGLRLASPAFLTDSRPAPQVLVDLATTEAAAGRTLTILTLGTLTNLAEAAALDTGFTSRVRVTSMLGAIDVPGNVSPNGEPNPVAEWNAHADPSAVRAVLEAAFDLTLVPLDATNDVPLTRDLYAELGTDHAAGPADLVYELWSVNTFMLDGGYHLWDPLSAAVIRDPSLVQAREARVRVVEGVGIDGGQLVEDPAGARVTIATSADRARFEALLLAGLRTGAPRANAFSPAATIEITVGDGVCEVAAPDPIPSGLVEVQLTSTGAGLGQALLFGLNDVTWAELEAFAADPDFENPPAVQSVAAVFLEAPGSGTAYGNVTEGPLGVACLRGDFAAPSIMLRGPFEVAP